MSNKKYGDINIVGKVSLENMLLIYLFECEYISVIYIRRNENKATIRSAMPYKSNPYSTNRQISREFPKDLSINVE